MIPMIIMKIFIWLPGNLYMKSGIHPPQKAGAARRAASETADHNTSTTKKKKLIWMWLVVSTPLKNINPNRWNNKKCSKPPTRFGCGSTLPFIFNLYDVELARKMNEKCALNIFGKPTNWHKMTNPGPMVFLRRIKSPRKVLILCFMLFKEGLPDVFPVRRWNLNT